MKTKYSKSYRSVYSLTAHCVFVTKYRKSILTDEFLNELEQIFTSVMTAKNGELLEFNGESDHVHLLISYKPNILLSNLIANLKATSSKTMWRNHADYLKQHYHKRTLWTGSYFVASCGGVTIEHLRSYVENQERPGS